MLTLAPTTHRLLDNDGRYVEVNASLLGAGTSYADGKDRWFEVRIYVDDEDYYIVHTMGKTLKEDEHDLGRVIFTTSPYEIIEVLTVRRVSRRRATDGDRTAAPYIPTASMRALAQAASRDAGIREAYVEVAA